MWELLAYMVDIPGLQVYKEVGQQEAAYVLELAVAVEEQVKVGTVVRLVV